MSKNSDTPKQEQPVGPYNPRHLQDLQDSLNAERQREFDERERAWYETLTPEQKKDHDEYEAAVRSRKKKIGVDDGKTYVVDTKSRIASRLGTSVRSLSRWIEAGKIDIEPLSRQRWRISETEIERLRASE